MSHILYYASTCNESSKLLQLLSRHQTNDIHFVNVDNRKIMQNGDVVVVLANASEIILPKNIKCVPAMILVNKGFHVLFGSDEIYNSLFPKIERNYKVNDVHSAYNAQSTNQSMRSPYPSNHPLPNQQQPPPPPPPPPSNQSVNGGKILVDDLIPFGSWDTTGMHGVASDNFSYYDNTDAELSAKGDGGMKQMYSYASIDHSDEIDTPPDDGMPAKAVMSSEGYSVDR
jgi:hypothetical protein